GCRMAVALLERWQSPLHASAPPCRRRALKLQTPNRVDPAFFQVYLCGGVGAPGTMLALAFRARQRTVRAPVQAGQTLAGDTFTRRRASPGGPGPAPAATAIQRPGGRRWTAAPDAVRAAAPAQKVSRRVAA